MTDPVAPRWKQTLRRAGTFAATFFLSLLWLWSLLAIFYSNLPGAVTRALAATLFALGVPVAAYRLRGRRPWWFLAIAGLIALWHLLIPPSNHRDWSPDQAVLARAEFDGDLVTVRGIRSCDYRTVTDYSVAYVDRTYDLRELDSADFVYERFSDWGAAAHTFLTFGFKGRDFLAVSIEIRKEKGESFGVLKGCFKQYELSYVLAEERDVIRLRTNYRKSDVFLYPVRASRENLRRLFVEMLERANALALRPEFYNTLASNCTTNVVRHVNSIAPRRIGFSMRYIFAGLSDELAYDLGLFDSALPFPALREGCRINDAAARTGDSPEFSRRIRDGRRF